MKKIFLVAAVAASAVALSSCGSSKNVGYYPYPYPSNQQQVAQQPYYQAPQQQVTQPQQQQEGNIPLNISKSVENAFNNQDPISVEMIDFGFGRSGDKAKAIRDAIKSAQNNIALRLYRSISSVDTEFAEDITLGDKITTKSKKSDMIVGIVDRKTSTISYTKAPSFTKVNGIYECDIEVKLTPELLRSITKEIYESLSPDDEVKVRFDEQQYYENVYKKQLDEYRNSQK